jgi:hypothetical protein
VLVKVCFVKVAFVLFFSTIFSAVNGGLKKLDFFKRELVQSYGLEALLAVSNLEKAGLLRKDAKAWWPPMKKVLCLSSLLASPLQSQCF